MNKTISIVCLALSFATHPAFASRHSAPPVRVDVRTSFGGCLATGVETVGSPSGGDPEQLDTTTMREGGYRLSKEGSSKTICVRNAIGVLGGRLASGGTKVFPASTHLVRDNVVVPRGTTAKFPFGAVVKFTENAKLVAESGAQIVFCGVALADALDDSVGGDSDLGVGAGSKASDGNWLSAPGHSWSILTFVDGGRTTGPTLRWTVGVSGSPATYGKLPSLPEKSGRSFAGWYTKSSGGTQITAATKVSAGSRTLYAHWSAKSATVSFNAGGGSGSMATRQLTGSASLPVNAFTRDGHVFIGWATRNGGPVAYANAASAKNLVSAGGNVTLYAVWAKKTYKVKFYANGGKGKMAVQTFTYGKAKKLSANKFKRSGYVFKGWATSKANAKKCVVKYKNKAAVKNLVTNGKTVKLYAVWMTNLENSLNAQGSTLKFTTGGHAKWKAVSASHDGNKSARSGKISHNKRSWVQTEVNGPGTISFWWKVSCEKCENDYGRKYDYLCLYIDGEDEEPKYWIHGKTGWKKVSHSFSNAGRHVLRWEYFKDINTSVGADCGWVDQVSWTPGK